MAKLLWTLKQQIGPTPRVGHAMAYDSQAKRMLLFGGLAGPALLADTWQWDGESWTQTDDIGPKPRWLAAMAYDSQRQRAVLFGGNDGTAALGDTWEWDGEDWTQVADAGPIARSGHVMAFDVARNRVLLFGGGSAQAPLADTWNWDGNEWTQVEDSGPEPRTSAAMTFDAARGRAVLFGGGDDAQVFGDTWEWDGTVWTQASGFGPPGCVGASMVYTGQRALLFGGSSSLSGSGTLFGNSWEWDGRHWTIRQDMGPGPRSNHAMAFDASRNRGVLFAGTNNPASAAAPLGDTWEQFEQAAVGGPPPLPPPAAVTVRSVTASQSAVEGQPVNLTVALSAAPPDGTKVAVALQDASGTSLLSQPFDPAQLSPLALFLPQGRYTVAAMLGGVGKSADFQVGPFAVPETISLSATPPVVARNALFSLNVSLSIANPEQEEIAIPLRVTAAGTTTVWLGNQLTVAPGQASGQLAIAGDFAPGTYSWTAMLSGATASADLQVM